MGPTHVDYPPPWRAHLPPGREHALRDTPVLNALAFLLCEVPSGQAPCGSAVYGKVDEMSPTPHLDPPWTPPPFCWQMTCGRQGGQGRIKDITGKGLRTAVALSTASYFAFHSQVEVAPPCPARRSPNRGGPGPLHTSCTCQSLINAVGRLAGVECLAFLLKVEPSTPTPPCPRGLTPATTRIQFVICCSVALCRVRLVTGCVHLRTKDDSRRFAPRKRWRQE